MIKKKSIAIDMDGVIADIEAQVLAWYENDFGIKYTREFLMGRSADEFFPQKGLVHKMVRTQGFFQTLPVMDGAIEAVKTLMKDFEVYIVSAAMEFPRSLSEKVEWLSEHFPFITWHNIIFCGDKSIIDTDYMIDDHIKNLDPFKGKTLMFNAYHNTTYTHHTRVNNWQEIVALLKAELKKHA